MEKGKESWRGGRGEGDGEEGYIENKREGEVNEKGAGGMKSGVSYFSII